MLKSSFVFLFSVFFTVNTFLPVYAAQVQSSTSVGSPQSIAEERLERLEGFVDKQQDEIDAGIKRLETKVSDYIFLRDMEYKLAILFFGVLAGILFGGWRTDKKLNEMVDQRVAALKGMMDDRIQGLERSLNNDIDDRHQKYLQRIADRFREEEETLRKTFESTRIEETFKKVSKVLIIFNEQDHALDLDFERFGFKRENIEREGFKLAMNEGNVLVYEEDYDLIILDSLKDEDVNNFVSSGSQSAYLIYHEGIPIVGLDRQRTNVANNKLTLYNRAIEVLNYKYMNKMR